jgi:hypothetical protein
MSDKKIIVVPGATGAQGGGLVRGILSDPDSPFSVRGITRNVGSNNARALAAAGAEMVAADFDDAGSGGTRARRPTGYLRAQGLTRHDRRPSRGEHRCGACPAIHRGNRARADGGLSLS